MTLRSGHGRGAGAPRVEVLPGDELPAASPAIAPQPEGGIVTVVYPIIFSPGDQ